MSSDAVPVLLFLAAELTFGVVLLYALASAWDQALSNRPCNRQQDKIQGDSYKAISSFPPMRQELERNVAMHDGAISRSRHSD